MKKAQCGECGRAGGYALYCMRCAEEMLKQSEQEKYKLAETDIYDFAGWLTTRAGVMKVGASSDASPMADAVGEYIKTFPNRFSAAPQRPWVGLTTGEIDLLAGKSQNNDGTVSYLLFARAIEAAHGIKEGT